MRFAKNIIGEKFGKLEVISREKNDKYKRAIWKCLCFCGNYTYAHSCDLRKGRRTSCGCLKRGKNHYRWQGYGEISGTVMCFIRDNAKRRNLEFNIEAKFLWELFLKQNKKCALSGMDIYFSDCSDSRFIYEKMTASLDRIDSSKGYFEGNVQWVHKWVNTMKWDLTDQEFIDICRKVINFTDAKN